MQNSSRYLAYCRHRRSGAACLAVPGQLLQLDDPRRSYSGPLCRHEGVPGCNSTKKNVPHGNLHMLAVVLRR